MATYLNIEYMVSVAKDRGGKCLSKVYKNNHTCLKWMCAKGHTWDSTWLHIQQGEWCRQCINDEIKKEYKDAMIAIALKKGGKCLDPQKEYVNNRTSFKWQCAKKHIFHLKAMHIKNGLWCKYCNRENEQALELKKTKKAAEKKGGKCLSKKFTLGKLKLKFQCKRKHIWMAAPDNIKKGNWCPECMRIDQSVKQTKYNIRDINKFVTKRRGKLLSKKYQNVQSILTLQCNKGHVWKAKTSNLIHLNEWCMECHWENRRLTIDEFITLAKKRGGRLLSKKYINAVTPLKWQCAEGHVWSATPASVKDGRWCRICGYKTISDKLRNKKKIKH